MENSSRTGWIVASILAVIIVILLGIMWKMHYDRTHDLDYVLNQGGTKIEEMRQEITEKCQGNDPMNQPECQDTLEELEDILRDFNKDLRPFTATTSVYGGATISQ